MRASRRLLVLGAAGITAVAAYPVAADATWPGKPGRIAYRAFDDADEGVDDGIYTVRADGRRNRRIVRRAESDAAWSRDGKRIAWFRTGSQLWQARDDGSRARLVLRLRRGTGLDTAWSPNGRRLVFTRSFEREIGQDERVIEVHEVWTVRRDGKGLRRLRRGHDATWSSRGLIGYATDDGDVATMRPDGRGRRIWVPQGSPVVVSNLDFSADGRRLAYQQSTLAITKETIRTVNLRTGRRTRFRSSMKSGGFARAVAWAPNDRRLASLHTPRRGPSRLRTIRPNGTRRKTLFEFPSGLTPLGFAWQKR